MVALGRGSGNIFQKSRVPPLAGEVEVRCFNEGTEAAGVRENVLKPKDGAQHPCPSPGAAVPPPPRAGHRPAPASPGKSPPPPLTSPLTVPPAHLPLIKLQVNP